MSSNKFDVLAQKYINLLDMLLESELLSFNSENLQAMLPQQMGVYCISEKINDVLETVYIGQSKNLQNRIYRNHLMGSRRFSTLKRKIIRAGMFSNEDDVKNYLRERCVVQFVIIENESDRNSFEHFAIAVLRPKFND